MAEHEAEPQPRQSVKLAEGTQHDQSRPPRLRRQRHARHRIGKAFIDDEPADARQQRKQFLRGRAVARPDCSD